MSSDSSEKNEAPKRAPRRRVAKPKTVSVVADTPVSASRRKSPTTLPTSSNSMNSHRKVSPKKYVALGLMISGLAIATFIGYSDKGQIDITAVISERNSKLTAGVSGNEGINTTNVTVPVQNTSNLPDGGLVGSTEPASVPLPPIVETATTSTTTASSTEEGSESATIEEGVTEPTNETSVVETISL